MNCRHGDFQSPALPTELPRLAADVVCVPHRWKGLVPICRDLGKLFLQILCNNLKSLPVPAILSMLPPGNRQAFLGAAHKNGWLCRAGLRPGCGVAAVTAASLSCCCQSRCWFVVVALLLPRAAAVLSTVCCYLVKSCSQPVARYEPVCHQIRSLPVAGVSRWLRQLRKFFLYCTSIRVFRLLYISARALFWPVIL